MRVPFNTASLVLVLGACAGSSPVSGTTPDAGSGASTVDSAVADGGVTDGGQPTSPVECDPRKILCKRVAPQCPEGQVPSVSGSCYGACVPAEMCPCDEAAACPDSNQFTCHMSAKHCGPYV